MALSSFQLFMSQAQNAPADLKLQVFKVVLDLLIMYPQEFFGRNDDIVSRYTTNIPNLTIVQSKRISDFLLHTLETEDSPEAQAILCTGICKLLLAGIVTDTRVWIPSFHFSVLTTPIAAHMFGPPLCLPSND